MKFVSVFHLNQWMICVYMANRSSFKNFYFSCSGNGICSVSGDPHYTTFDKHTHHYMGACSYTLTKPCNVSSGLPYFSVDTQNEHRGSNKQVSYVSSVVINVNGVTVILGKGRVVQVCYLILGEQKLCILWQSIAQISNVNIWTVD